MKEYAIDNPGGTPPAAPSNLVAIAASSSQINLSRDDISDASTFEIERTSDPETVGFSFINYVLAGTTTYQDTNLDGDSTWYYRVKATNSSGSSGYSNVASATTQPTPVPKLMYIDSISVSTSPAGGGLRNGSVTVVIRDDALGLVEGATVTGDFNCEITEEGVSSITGADGSATIESTVSTTSKGNVNNLEFCVTGVTHPPLTYGDMGANCGTL